MKRQLVTIRTIAQLLPIEGASRIEIAIIDGWQVIVKVGEFKPNDKCVFFEIDSFIPSAPALEFLGKLQTYEGKQGYRLKTMKMRGTLSQGLALPLSILKDRNYFREPDLSTNDLAEQLGVVKYDIDTQNSSSKPGMKIGQTERNFPSFIPKTDQERIQNLTSKFITSKDEEYEETMKMDGSSMTCYKIDKPYNWLQKLLRNFIPMKPKYHFGVCSRNLELRRPTASTPQSDFWALAIKHNIEKHLPSGYAIQGEICGPKIQSNHEKLTENQYYVFDVYDINVKKYLTPIERRIFFMTYLFKSGIQHVSVRADKVKIFSECPTVQDLLARVDTESINPGTISEGRVYKNARNPQDTFKCINNKYLLKSER